MCAMSGAQGSLVNGVYVRYTIFDTEINTLFRL